MDECDSLAIAAREWQLALSSLAVQELALWAPGFFDLARSEKYFLGMSLLVENRGRLRSRG
jgi:hypothetical protein